MPAFAWEIEAAVSEGAKILPGAAVIRFLLKDGRVAAFVALKVERVGLDPDGRVVPQTFPGSEFEVPADTVGMAMGSRFEYLRGSRRRRGRKGAVQGQLPQAPGTPCDRPPRGAGSAQGGEALSRGGARGV